MEGKEKPAGAATPDGLKNTLDNDTDYRRPAPERKDSSAEPIKYLGDMHPNAAWVLTAIEPDGPGIETRTFMPDQRETTSKWVNERVGRLNLYWQVNPPMRSLNKKARREDIKEVSFFHVDMPSKLQEALRNKFATPQAALRALGLPSSLLDGPRLACDEEEARRFKPLLLALRAKKL